MSMTSWDLACKTEEHCFSILFARKITKATEIQREVSSKEFVVILFEPTTTDEIKNGKYIYIYYMDLSI